MDDQNIFWKDLLDNLHDGVYFVDEHLTITYWNRSAEEITGFAADEVVGRRCPDNILRHINHEGLHLCDEGCPLRQTLQDGEKREGEVFLHHKKGHRVPIMLRVSPIYQDGRIVGAVESFSDNSKQMTLLQRIAEVHQLALLDPLTGLANRRYGEITLRSRLSELKRYGWPFGVLFIDIDHFKRVNDRYGHNTGDAVLQMVTNTLRCNLRSFDLICRWGGEEFLVIVANVSDTQLAEIAHKLRLLVEESVLEIGEESLRVTVSIGAAFAQHTDNTESLIDRGDHLMYQSKLAGRNRVSIEYQEPAVEMMSESRA
jgi:diguanylate cyclase (GGDEF)-like protein/PAS domain S-box-containing protein